MNYATEKNNKVYVMGEIVSDKTFSHEVYGEGFYEFFLKVMRLSGQADILPDDIYSLGGIAVYLGYDANRGQHFENDLLAVMRRSRDVTERLFYGRE